MNDFRLPVLLFDIDGTLLRGPNQLHFQAFEHALAALFGLEADRATMQVAGMLDRHIVMEILALNGRKVPVEDPVLDDACREVEDYYLSRSGSLDLSDRVLPGAPRVLARLKEMGFLAGLLTGNLERVAWEKMRISGLLPHLSPFGGFGCSPVASRGRLVDLALKRAGKLAGRAISPRDTVLVGDTPRDIRAARDAGASVVSICGGSYGKEELAAHGPDLLIESYAEEDRLFQFLAGWPQDDAR
jgi:phosphoglycolate phosphatase-like HAD superfamily hydrolase